jgi:hypothetical protein
LWRRERRARAEAFGHLRQIVFRAHAERTRAQAVPLAFDGARRTVETLVSA